MGGSSSSPVAPLHSAPSSTSPASPASLPSSSSSLSVSPSSPSHSPLAPPSPWRLSSSTHRSLICVFCGGRGCIRENYKLQKDTPAIIGLNSTWISKSIMGMSRPSSRLIKEHGIVEQFRKSGIQCVINCQLQGEHSLCGDGIQLSSGFSYLPTDFTDFGIFYYNFGWIDMSIPTLSLMLNIVKVIDYHVSQQQKCAVHCHAGFGRTGITIASYFVYSLGLTPKQAIESVRTRRPGSVQNKRQVKFVKNFYYFLKLLRLIFVDVEKEKEDSNVNNNNNNNSNPNDSSIGTNNSTVSPDSPSNSLPPSSFPPSSPSYLLPKNNKISPSPSPSFDEVKSKDDDIDPMDPPSEYPLPSSSSSSYQSVPPSPSLSTAMSASTIPGSNEYDFSSRLHRPFPFSDLLFRQRQLLAGAEREIYKKVPKFIKFVTDRLILCGETSPFFLAECVIDGFRSLCNIEEQKEIERIHFVQKQKNAIAAAAAEAKLKSQRIETTVMAPSSSPSPSSISSSTVNGKSSPPSPPSPAIDLSTVPTLHFISSLGFNSSHLLDMKDSWIPPSSTPPSASASSSSPSSPSKSPTPSSSFANSKFPLHESVIFEELKHKINNGDYSFLSTCDPRLSLLLLLQFLESLKFPIMDLWRKGGKGKEKSQIHERENDIKRPEGSHNKPTNPSPLPSLTDISFLSLLPPSYLPTIHCIITLLRTLRDVDSSQLSRVYLRVAFALIHPPLPLPESVSVTYWKGNSKFPPKKSHETNNDTNTANNANNPHSHSHGVDPHAVHGMGSNVLSMDRDRDESSMVHEGLVTGIGMGGLGGADLLDIDGENGADNLNDNDNYFHNGELIVDAEGNPVKRRTATSPSSSSPFSHLLIIPTEMLHRIPRPASITSLLSDYDTLICWMAQFVSAFPIYYEWVERKREVMDGQRKIGVRKTVDGESFPMAQSQQEEKEKERPIDIPSPLGEKSKRNHFLDPNAFSSSATATTPSPKS